LGDENFRTVANTRVLEEFTANGQLVNWREVDAKELLGDVPDNIKTIVEQKKIDFISYPYEWSFSHLKSAAVLYLELLLKSLEKDVILIDGSAFNIQFVGNKPIFIDLLSFVPYIDGQYWIGHKQFCEHFLNPLILSSKFGIPHNYWFRGGLNGLSTKDCASLLGVFDWFSPNLLVNVLLPTFFEQRIIKKRSQLKSFSSLTRGISKNSLIALIRKMKNSIEALDYKPSRASTWANYKKNNTYMDDEFDQKTQFISEFISSTKPSCLWDLGCNVGYFSELALSKGTNYVIGLENDRDAQELASTLARKKNLNFLPLFMDLTNPSPSQGWNLLERPNLFERINADGVLALAIIHHLVFHHNIPLDRTVELITELAPQGIIEYIPKNDQMAVNLIGDRNNLFSDYSYENMLELIRKKNNVVTTKKITSSERTLIWYKKRS